MSISVTRLTGNAAKNTYMNTLTRVNQKFSSLKITAGKNIRTSSFNTAIKTAVAIDAEFLQKVTLDSGLEEKLEGRLGKIKKANQAIDSINQLGGRRLNVQGYTIDKRGNIFCVGVDAKTNEEFKIELGGVDSKENFASKIYDHFDISQSHLLFTSYKGRVM